MRLTLRTLLAYLDKILDPEDQEELSRRVAASDVANDLLHRTRDATRRLRQPAPAVDASGPHSDANTVAEYLDNTLPPDDVTEFERRCLDLEHFPDADSHLAEVAVCHHVLTMVLGQRAEIDDTTKQQVYALAHPASTGAAPAASATTEAEPPITERSAVTEIPDYLRASDRSLLGRMLPAVAALVLLGVTAYFALRPGGWLNKPTDVALNNAGGSAEGSAENNATEAPDTQAAQPDAAGPDAPRTDAAGPGAPGPDAAGAPPAGPDAAGVEPAGVDPVAVEAPDAGPVEIEAPVEAPPADGLPLSGADPVVPPFEPGAPPSILPDEPSTPPSPIAYDPAPDEPLANLPDSGADPLADPDTVEPIEPLPPSAADGPAGQDEAPAPTDERVASDGRVASDAGDAESDVEPDEPEPPKRLGVVFSQSGVLLRRDVEQGHWLRVADRAAVMPGDMLLSLPTYSPAVAFDSEVVLDMFDGARVDVGEPQAGQPTITLTYGRVMLTNMGKQPAEMNLTIGALTGTLRLGAGSALAVDAERLFEPGVDPRETPSPLVTKCYAPVGDIAWDTPGATIAADERGMWIISDEQVGELTAYADDPEWLAPGGRPKSRDELQASPRLAAQLGTGSPIWEQLSAVNQSSRKEERALATRCAVHIGHFDSTIQALRDEEQHLSWADEVAALRFAMSSSPALAQAVYDELRRQRPREFADELYEMLCGYNLQQVGATPEEWRVGAMRTLIDRLGSDQLDYRVLANYNLEQITGRRGVFNPIGPSGARETSINRQRARLEAGELEPKGLLAPEG